MKRGFAWVGAALVAGAFSAGAGEEIDWGRLADHWLAGEVQREKVNERSVLQGAGGIRVEKAIITNEKDLARMRKILEVIDKQPDPRPKKKPVKIFLQRETFDPFGGKFHKGDWNQGAPFVGTKAKAKPRG